MSAVLAALLLTVSPQTEVFYNARLALKDHAPTDALRLWLLRNSLRQQGQLSALDPEFRSVVWASLGELGLCPDGLPFDDQGGATIWPLALHNEVVVTVSRALPPDEPAPFESFEVGRQQRLISLYDVLDADELRTAAFHATTCLQPATALADRGLPPPGDLTDRIQFGMVLRSLLEDSLKLVDPGKVLSLALVKTRIFDLNLELARLEEAQLKRVTLQRAQATAQRGGSKAAVAEVRAQAESLAAETLQAAFLREVYGWSTDDWLSLSTDRRLSLFARARKYAPTPEARDALALRLIDALIERKRGAEVDAWLSLYEADAARRVTLVDGERGKRLLELDPETGFRERAPIALARGVLLLERGERREALRSFAAALRASGDSRDSGAAASLSRRWLSWLLGSFETNDELIATLKALVPPVDYNSIIEDLVWKAALRADQASFERLVKSSRHGGSFDARAGLLEPLAQGKAGAFIDRLVDTSGTGPHATLRFVNLFLEHVESEELEVRRALSPVLTTLARTLDAMSARTDLSKGQLRQADELAARAQAILTGLGLLDETQQGRARSLSPAQAAFAGNLRLAPADPMPWPFPALDPIAPSPFRSLKLTPIEWRDPAGTLVFGWRISE